MSRFPLSLEFREEREGEEMRTGVKTAMGLGESNKNLRKKHKRGKVVGTKNRVGMRKDGGWT